jgi:hypothetical protein
MMAIAKGCRMAAAWFLASAKKFGRAERDGAAAFQVTEGAGKGDVGGDVLKCRR